MVDPDEALISAYQPSRGAWIERMPVTKRVELVTVGDLARESGCSAPYSFWVTEHQDGGWAQETWRAQAQADVALPITPGRVTFQIAPTTLRKGRAYSVSMSNPYSGCSSATLRTWAHDGAQVNGGPQACQLADDYTNMYSRYRMWHDEGAEDAVTCPPFASTAQPQDFDASMPTGWLQIGRGSSWNSSYVTTGNGWDPNFPCIDYRPYGVRALEWGPHPTYPTTRYVCDYDNYAPLGQNPDNGWYWGRPHWADRDGALRDTYVKLETIDYDTLLERHSPRLLYDGDEDFHALSPGAATDFFDDSDSPDDPEDSNQLEDAGGVFATANPMVSFGVADDLNLGYLGSVYSGFSRRNGTDAHGADFISLRGNGQGPGGIGFSSDGYDADAAQMEARPGYSNRVYGRVAYWADSLAPCDIS